jgi:glutaredoxin
MKMVKIFTSNKCPKCPQAKQLGMRLTEKRFAVQFHDVDTAAGLAEAALNGVLATPSILVMDGESEAVIRDWRGVLPAEGEVLHALG